MHFGHSRKRQNRGSSSIRHQDMDDRNISQSSLGAVASEDNLNHSGSLFTGFHRVMNQERTSSQHFQIYGFEPRSSSIARFSSYRTVPDDGWNTLPVQRSSNNAIRISTSPLCAYGSEQDRNSHKRKSPMDPFPGLLTHRTSDTERHDVLGLRHGLGTRRSNVLYHSACDGSGVRREGQDGYQYLSSNGVFTCRYDGLMTVLPWDNHCSPFVRSERALSTCRRRIPAANGTINRSVVGNINIDLPETFTYRQGNAWPTSMYLDEGSRQTQLSERNFNASAGAINFRQGEPLDVMNRLSIENEARQHSNRIIRTTPFISNPHTNVSMENIPLFPLVRHSGRYGNTHSQIVCLPESVSGLEATVRDMSIPRQYMPRHIGLNRTTPVRQQLSFRRSRVLPSERVDDLGFSTPYHVPNQSLAYEWTDTRDQHSDMRLDVDNMSYEELLALEERIGNVNTGLSEESIRKCLKVKMYSPSDVISASVSRESDPKCSICQEEYEDSDELGELQCGHEYHTDCIKQWLPLKNQCPICKSAAW
ncbi:hypothetical protein KP509_01G128900 [Ceratopteris richardii]|uniref:RING-type E3 ubiquitin transferase n=1 Tax=Ceratopteris richardii TaxID=49495 RepID=A0A8T2VKW2_CERRI|nr:hypothetical protein KP509_01G128900 [Ceratopteris richardii]KAH7447942.1 hypothetical protein KP509_01G128900 [Ceratopteris richardii]KAH7447943.1 hypothetical protein KP509_01G128900 [Ceratopteris richardii]